MRIFGQKTGCLSPSKTSLRKGKTLPALRGRPSQHAFTPSAAQLYDFTEVAAVSHLLHARAARPGQERLQLISLRLTCVWHPDRRQDLCIGLARSAKTRLSWFESNEIHIFCHPAQEFPLGRETVPELESGWLLLQAKHSYKPPH